MSAVSRKRRKWRYECGCEGKEVLVIMPFGLPVRSREFVLYPPPAAVCRCSCAPEAWPKKSDNRKGSGNNRIQGLSSKAAPRAGQCEAPARKSAAKVALPGPERSSSVALQFRQTMIDAYSASESSISLPQLLSGGRGASPRAPDRQRAGYVHRIRFGPE